MQTAKVIRGTGDVTIEGVVIVSAIQVVGGTAVSSLYNGTSAVAANKVAQVTSAAAGAWLEFQEPIRLQDGLFFDAGAGLTEVFIHRL